MKAPYIFILGKPDLFLRGLLPRFLCFLEAHHFFVREFFFGQVNKAHFHLMYSTHFRSDVDDWHHNKKMYAFGPALGLLLENSKMEFPQEWLKQIKGAALPKERNKDSLRSLFGSRSRLFNLVHVPDSAEQSEREALSWFGRDSLKNLQFNEQLISSEMILKEYDQSGYQKISSLDPECAFLYAKIRLMHALQKRSFLLNFHAILPNIKKFYTAWIEEIAACEECNGIEGTHLSHYYRLENEHLTALEGIMHEPAFLNVIHLLKRLSEKPRFATNFFWILDEWNVFINDLEHYLILSRLKYNYT